MKLDYIQRLHNVNPKKPSGGKIEKLNTEGEILETLNRLGKCSVATITEFATCKEHTVRFYLKEMRDSGLLVESRALSIHNQEIFMYEVK